MFLESAYIITCRSRREAHNGAADECAVERNLVGVVRIGLGAAQNDLGRAGCVFGAGFLALEKRVCLVGEPGERFAQRSKRAAGAGGTYSLSYGIM